METKDDIILKKLEKSFSFFINSKYHVLVVLSLTLLLFIIIAILFSEGSGEAGYDHFRHFLISKYALLHPSLFLDQWGKPLLTTLSTFFAQFGIIGNKIFNILFSILAAYMTFLTAKELQLKKYYFSIYFVLFSPVFFHLSILCMTEILFAFVLILALWLYVKGKLGFSVMVVSLLPFARQEGYLFVLLWLIIIVFKKRYKLVPLLFISAIIYSLANWIINKDLLVLVNKFPYGKEGVLGSGTLTHFFEKFVYITGPVISYFFILGFISSLLNGNIDISKNRLKMVLRNINIFHLCFIIFFCSHVFAWWQGSFASGGAVRVFVSVIPVIAIISVHGIDYWYSSVKKGIDILFVLILLFISFISLNISGTSLASFYSWLFAALTLSFLVIKFFIGKETFNKYKESISIIIILTIIFVPFKQYKFPLRYDNTQLAIMQMKKWMVKNSYSDRKMYFYNPFIAYAMNIDPFDNEKSGDLTWLQKQDLKTGDIVIWDINFGESLAYVPLDYLLNNPLFRLIKIFRCEKENFTPKIYIFEKVDFNSDTFGKIDNTKIYDIGDRGEKYYLINTEPVKSMLLNKKQRDFDIPVEDAPYSKGIQIESALACSTNIKQGTKIAILTVYNGNKTYKFDIIAGVDTSEWAFNRPDVKKQIKHRRAKISCMTKEVTDKNEHYNNHLYYTEKKFDTLVKPNRIKLEYIDTNDSDIMTLIIKNIMLIF